MRVSLFVLALLPLMSSASLLGAIEEMFPSFGKGEGGGGTLVGYFAKYKELYSKFISGKKPLISAWRRQDLGCVGGRIEELFQLQAPSRCLPRIPGETHHI